MSSRQAPVYVLACAALLTALSAPFSVRAESPTTDRPIASDAEVTSPSKSLAILDFALSGDIPPELARTLGDVAAQEAARLGSFQVISQRDVVAQLGHEQTKQLLGCDDSSCYAELSGALNTDLLISGSVSLVESTYLFTMSLIDVRQSRPVRRASETLPRATQAELLDASKRLAHEALTGNKLDTTGVVRIEVTQPGALVTIGGREIGRSPIAGSQRLPEGDHTIVVQKDGFVRWESTVTVGPGASVPVVANLVPLASVDGTRSRAWTFGYVTAGIAVAAVAAGGVFGYMANESHKGYSAATLRSQAVSLRRQTEDQALIANIAFGVGGVAALSSGALFVTAVVSDASRSAAASAPIKADSGDRDRTVGLAVAGTF